MSFDGHLTDVYCKRCGKALNADGGHPAETYLGTFNGLCYKCTSEASFPIKRYSDGAQEISHPPFTPSYRRDRQVFIGYAGCETCGGSGRTIVSRSNAFGGSYPQQCESCSERFFNHPIRKEYAEARKAIIDGFWDRVHKAEKKAKRAKRILTEEEKQAFRIEYEGLMEQYGATLAEEAERLGEEKIEPKGETK